MSALNFQVGAVPGTPATGFVTLYPKSDGKWYFKAEDGVEYQLQGISRKAGVVAGASFSGTPKKFAVVFSAPFADTNYSIQMAGTDSRNYTYESKLTTGFTINANASTAISGEVSWHAAPNGET